MNRIVICAALHEVPFVLGLGQLKSTLSVSTYTGMKMLWASDGMYVDYNNVSFVVPHANVKVATFAEPGVVARELAATPVVVTATVTPIAAKR